MTPSPLSHADPSRPDERLTADAAAHMARYPALQVVAELLTRLREMSFPWWTAEQLRNAYPATDRMHWFGERADLRQRITSQLTGLAPRAARNKTPDFQAELIDSVIDEGDISADGFENAFEPADLAVYGPAADFFRLFKKRMPWDDDATPHQDLIGWFIGALLADKSALDGSPRQPILSAVQVRMAIDGRVWHSRIPLHVRVAIDDARFAAQRDRPNEPYGVERDLTIATPALIAASIPLKDLLPVIDVAAHALGFDDAPPAAARAAARETGTRAPAARAEGTDDGPREAPPPASKSHFLALPDDMPGVKESRPPPPMPASVRSPAKSEAPPPRAPSVKPPAPVKAASVAPPALVTAKSPAKETLAKEPADKGIPKPPSIPFIEEKETSPGSTEAPSDLEDSTAGISTLNQKTPFEIADPETSNEPGPPRESGADELEHTNPWNALGDLASQIAGDLRGGKKGSGD
ncbi:MAG: hypothetical protein JNK04_07195 [Myxococcales bacterium]|nr:hypothetical protein [Myxococcales bacterium]